MTTESNIRSKFAGSGKITRGSVPDLNETEKQLLSQVLKAVRNIEFGCVRIVVQDSKVLQIENTEKMRLDTELVLP